MPNGNMMIVDIDFSVLTEKRALGRVSGRLEFLVAPQIGDNILFPLVVEGQSLIDNDILIDLARRQFSVMSRRIYPSGNDVSVSLSLDDVIVLTTEHGLELMKYFESAHGLFGEAYEL